ncbi:hypothetical protein [Flavobacterium sp.]|uniref:hypothetical protein n=1 Tax=Flavobacterium sp. TaxID=239 RepID=UPI00261D6D60|nr:hypothetical protein [Flavobacterium sp.]
MNKKFYVITIVDGNAIKIKLKKWWRDNIGPTNKISHALFFALLADGWKSEVIGNEILLISADAVNGGEEEIVLPNFINQNEEFHIAEINNTDGNFELMSTLFSSFIESYTGLKEHGILRNQKYITGQLGEWIASILFEADIATNGINQYWDLEDAQGNKYQVKSHAKSHTTNARWSKIEYPANAPINFIVIVVFNPNYKLQELYKIPFEEALNRCTSKYILNWIRVNQYKFDNLRELLQENNLGFIAS